MRHLRERQAEIAGVAALLDRSGGGAQFDWPYRPLAEFAMESRPPDLTAVMCSCAFWWFGSPYVVPMRLCLASEPCSAFCSGPSQPEGEQALHPIPL